MKDEKLYRKAVEIATAAEERFLEAVEANRRAAPDLMERHRELFVQPAAAEACAQQSLIAELFGVSEEKVNEDLARVILARGAGKEVGA